MKKKLLIMVIIFSLVICMMFSLFACANDNNGETGSGETGSGEINSGETNSGEIGSGEIGSGEINSGETNSGETNSGETNSGEIGSGETNSGETNSGEIGSGDTEENYTTSLKITLNLNKTHCVVYGISDDAENVVIPSSYNGMPVKEIAEKTFYECTSIKSIEMPDSIIWINEMAFKGCTSLKSVKLSNNLSAIKSSAFEDCVSLESLVIPSGVTLIGSGTFNNCNNLSIYCEMAGPIKYYVDEEKFCGRPVTWAYNNITSNFYYDYVVHNGEVYLTKYKRGIVDNLVIPSSIDGMRVVSIGNIFTMTKKAIKNIFIPNGVTSIGDRAFIDNDKLESIEIPKSVINIGKFAFDGCESLKVIICEASEKQIGWDFDWNKTDNTVSYHKPGTYCPVRWGQTMNHYE